MMNKIFLLILFSALISTSAAVAGEDEMIAAKLKSSGYRCTDTPDGAGIFCTGNSPANYIVIPKGVDKFEKTVFYAHGLVGVCGNGASGENYLKNQAKTLKALKAVSLMPYRASAGNVGFPMASHIQKMDGLIGGRPLLLAGHSAAGPFFASELNGNGAGVLSRVEKILILDGGYGDLRERYDNVMKRNSKVQLSIVATTTAGKSQALASYLQAKYGGRVKIQTFGGDHCSVPEKYFRLLAN